MERDFRKINDATLRLFKAVYNDGGFNEIPLEVTIEAASKGILFAPNVSYDNGTAINAAVKMYGVDLFKISNTFHKTWDTVQEIDPMLHYLQQIVHYFTTYGFDELGVDYNANNAYIPNEKVMLPEGAKTVNFTIIKEVKDIDIADRLNTLVSSGVALSQQMVDDVLYLVNAIGCKFNFDAIKNKEVRTALWLGMDDRPYITGDEFLRALLFVVSGKTLLVRSYRDHQMLKWHLKCNVDKQQEVSDLIKLYQDKFGIEKLASGFLRNRMIWLGFKCDATKVQINKINRLADKYHKAMDEVYLKEEDILSANVWQLVKYYNLCVSNLNPTQDKLYNVRNGKNFLKENPNYGISGEFKRVIDNHYSDLLEMVEAQLYDKLAHMEGKIFLIPSYLEYKVPSSLKRLCQGLPEGSTISFPEGKPFVVGIHWENQVIKGRENRVDLDLHANSINGSIGWCNSFRNEEVLFSGDMTDAPVSKGGASEAILFSEVKAPYLVTLNDYTQSDGLDYKFIFDTECKFNFKNRDSYGYGRDKNSHGYIFSPSARVLNSKINGKDQGNIGLVMKDKFYFMNSTMFSGPVTYKSEFTERLINYFEESQVNQLTFRKLADIVGFRVIDSLDEIAPKAVVGYNYEVIEEDDKYMPDYVDLSLEAITEDTFPQLFTGE